MKGSIVRLRSGMWAGLLALAILGAVPATAATTKTCNGFAPTKTSCTTGGSVSTSALSHDVAADINYVGTVESSMVWGSKARTFRCTYTQALRRTCVGSGEFPPANTAFTHQCRSLFPATAFSADPALVMTGVEGGVGTWACSVTV